jgi:adenosylmethionine-8-amino-7-oxononanoate aminotransferase
MAEIVRNHLELLEQHPLVGETRQSGLAASVVLVPNKDRRRYFPSELALGDKVQALGWRHGVMLRPVSDDAIVIAPPLIIEASEIELLFEAIHRTLDEAWSWLATRRSEWS